MAKKKGGVARGLPASVFQAVKKETTKKEAAGLAQAFRQQRRQSGAQVTKQERALIRKATRIAGQAIPGRDTVPTVRGKLMKRASSAKKNYPAKGKRG